MLRFFVTLVAGVVIGVMAVLATRTNAQEEEDQRMHHHGAGRPQRSNASSGDVPRRPPASICVVCVENFGSKPLEQLPCLHLFHRDCIMIWLEQSSRCPICRHELTSQQTTVYKQRNSPAA